MAQIDVTDLFTDPDFVDNVTIISRRPSINNFGENTLLETCTATVGCVQPASGKTMQRLPEALQVANLTSFWVKGTITTSAPNKYPDILVFKGQRYQVQTVFDWSNWGAGWSEGTCIVEVPAP